MTASLSEKSALRQFIVSWRGRPLTSNELDAGFDLEKLIGANCQLQIIHQLGRDGKTYANIGAILPIKGVPPMHVEGYVRKASKPKDEDPVPF